MNYLKTTRRHRNLHLALLFGRPRVGALVVKSRHGENLGEITGNLSYCMFDPQVRPPVWCIRFWIRRIFFVSSLPAEIRTLSAIAETLRVRVVISTDQYRDLLTAERHLQGIHFYWIQHGLFFDQRSEPVRREEVYPDRETSVTLFALSAYDCENYRRWGARPNRVIPVGSLNNAVYLTHTTTCRDDPSPNYDLCIVEKGVSPDADSDLGMMRRDSFAELLESLAPYCLDNSLKVVVALSQSSSQDAVLQWIRQKFPYNFDIVCSNHDFATYRTVDRSNVTIGQISTVLSEALCRNRKVLSVNFTSLSYLVLPGGGIASITRPSKLQLAERLDEIRRSSWAKYWSAVSAETRALTVANPNSAVSTINQIVMADLDPSIQRTKRQHQLK